jgi:predicted metalloprotease with PDZ domain
VLDASPADQAGLQSGDRIVMLNGHAIGSPGDLTDQLDRTLAGTEVVLDILRGKRTEHRTVHTVSRPPSASTSTGLSEPAPASNPDPKADDLHLTLPREVIERIERLERRLEALEKRAGATP